MENAKALCLALVPFDSAFGNVWMYGIVEAFRQPALVESWQCRRGEDVFMAAPFIEPIHGTIRTAQLVIADVTTRDPAILYQLGYARAAGKAAVAVAQEGTPDPFAGGGPRFLTYAKSGTPADLAVFAATLAEAIAAQTVAPVGTETVTEDAEPTGYARTVPSVELSEVIACIERTGHRDWEVRREAVRELSQFRTPEAVDGVLRALTDENWNVRAAASLCVREMDDPNVFQAVVDLLYDDRPFARRAAVWTLREIGGDVAIRALLGHFDDEAPGVREAVAWAFKELKDERAVPALIRALQTDEPLVRRAAAEALAMQEDPSALPVLRQSCRHPDPSVRAASARAVGIMKDKDAVDTLVALLKDPGWPVRQAAARALGDIGDPAALKPLITALNDAEEDVRWAVIESVVQLRTDASREVLRRVVRDDMQTDLVRDIARAALADEPEQ